MRVDRSRELNHLVTVKVVFFSMKKPIGNKRQAHNSEGQPSS